MKIASYYILQDNYVKCELCPHNCLISDMKEGICKVRRNVNKVLYSLNYGVVTAINIDPIEKKPLYHFWPGSKILSIGTKGCNFKCIFCQNHHISQRDIQDNDFVDNYHPEQIIDIALRQKNNIGIAYTYNEPIIWYEFVLDTAKLANKKGLKNVMVTNGFINQKPLKDLLKYIDAFNI
ncbi:MAG TPA: radical SAM protein, partial [Bacteroidales bacterium]|nr:radical SAM protein [Bacteroidales bacterium]